METGKIKTWMGSFGFIADDSGGPDVYVHINEVQHGDRNAIGTGSRVEFEKGSSKKFPDDPKKFQAYNVRLQTSDSETGDAAESDGEQDDYFHNPYTFVSTPPRPSNGFAGDFNPLKHSLDHASLKDGLWTGYIPIKLTTVTPLILLKSDDEDRSTNAHQTDVLDYLPESSLRGMLRSAYEIVTNSRYGCFSNDNRLAYRMAPPKAVELIPAIIENVSGKLEVRLYPGTSKPTPKGPSGRMYAAMLDKNLRYVGGGEPKTRDKVWAEIVHRPHGSYSYWKAIKVWSKIKNPTKPSTGGKVVKGHVFITNENMGNKHDERIFFNPQSDTFDLTDDLKEAWRMRIQSYRDAHTKAELFEREDRHGKNVKPWEKIGNNPGKTAWSPHLYQDGQHKDRWGRDVHDSLILQEGDMVYARCKFDKKTGDVTGITDLFPVMISRELYADSPADLLDCSLKPAKVRNELSPADRLFGWVPQNTERDDDTVPENEGGYKSRIRVICEDDPRPGIIQSFEGGNLPLTILGQPKPAQGRFYVAKDKDGNPQKNGLSKEEAGYSNSKSLRGRKQYWHHRGLEAERDKKKQKQCYWQPSVEDRTQIKRKDRYQEYRRPDNRPDEQNPEGGWQQTDSQNRSITGWIQPYTEFKVSLYVQNLEPEELGALLWLLTLKDEIDDGEKRYFRLGYGKPLGFGSLTMEIDWESDGCSNGCLPLGTREDWKAYYDTLDVDTCSPVKLDEHYRRKHIQNFKSSMEAGYPNKNNYVTGKKMNFGNLLFINGFLKVLRGPVPDAPIHYPRLEHPEQGQYKPNPAGKNFEWFTDNERGIKRDEDGKRCVLPNVTDEGGLPYKPSKPKQ